MDRVAPAGLDLRTPGLGYGCASLMARISRRASEELLETAFDSGIEYFDVARSYGYGEAESALGGFASRRRDRVAIATKLGIEPPPRGSGLRVARAVGRPLARLAPPLRAALRRRAEGLAEHGAFALDAARSSLETSLRELRTDRVDVLLLHECEPADVTPELLGFLRERLRAGEVGRYGIATGVAAAREIVAAHPDEPLVVQVPFDPLATVEPPLAPPRGGALVTHSALARIVPLRERLATLGEEDRRRWSELLDADLGDAGGLAPLLLGAALAASGSTALFGSRRPERIAANAAATPLAPERARALAQLGQQLFPR